ncbi:MAG: hypothetical protein LBG88_01965 [Christensenellaceae bacterium]|jgi:hypothetical protein|nr:hypothetical protein [Christensenellaceae bacterium]
MKNYYELSGKSKPLRVNRYGDDSYIPFQGYIETVGEPRHELDPDHGVVEIQDFRGGLVSNGNKQNPSFVDGCIRKCEQTDTSISFTKSSARSDLSYEFFLNPDGSCSTGWWSQIPFDGEIPANLAKFEQLTEKQVGVKKVKNFLGKVYGKHEEKEF